MAENLVEVIKVQHLVALLAVHLVIIHERDVAVGQQQIREQLLQILARQAVDGMGEVVDRDIANGLFKVDALVILAFYGVDVLLHSRNE